MARKKSGVPKDLPGKSFGKIKHVRPKKNLGQHFLRRKEIAVRIVDSLKATGEDTVIEIGAGTGELTKLIIKQAGRIVAVEVDKTCFPSLEVLSELNPNLVIFSEDIRHLGLSEYGKVLVLGNLPYHLSGEILFWLLGQREHWIRAVLTVQAEFADRLTALVGTHDYSALSVVSQTFLFAEKLFDIPSDAFVPPPRVRSTTITLEPLEDVTLPVHPVDFVGFVRKCFAHRRKTLANNLKMMGVDDPAGILDKLGHDVMIRPQELSPYAYIKLVNAAG